MKIRTIAIVAVAVMMVSMFTMTAMAADQDRIRQHLNDGSCTTSIVDSDGDGVCDNFVDADGDGVCDNCQGTGDCDGDQLQDGSCDNDCDGDGPDRLRDKDGSCQ